MHSLVFLAAPVALWVALTRSPWQAFLAVYLPLLLLVPESFRATLSGIPKMNFNQAAIVPIVALVLLRHLRGWRPSATDAAVLALALLIAVSEFLAAGYKEAQNLMFAMGASMAAPYLVARLLSDAPGRDVALARRIVIVAFAVAIVGLYESRFGRNPFLELLAPLFPGQGYGWVTTFRHGFARVAGPYSHAILAGIVMVTAFRLARWLQWGGHWEPRFARLPRLPWSKAAVLSAVLALGSLMTVARGPLLGAALGAVAVSVFRSPRRGSLLPAAAVGAAVLLPLGYLGLVAYLDVAPGMQMTASQESALYRKVMIERYVGIALDHALLGWGRNTWPKLPGMASIDNYFLLLSLMHGVVATALLAFLFAWQSVRLFRRGLAEPHDANGLALTFGGILVAALVALGTVYLGEQVMPLLFLILGWSEAVLQRAPLVAAPSAASPKASGSPLARGVAQGNVAQGNAAQGNAAQGNAAQGNAAQGNAAQGGVALMNAKPLQARRFRVMR
jgi:hypothetical protein